MRIQIETREIEEEQTLAKFRELRVKSTPMLGEYCGGLLEKFFIVEDSIG